MQNVSGILDVATGLVFVYLLLSLICSALTEVVENWWLRCRGKKLYQGLKELFGGAKAEAFVNTFYQNPLIYGLYRGDLNLEKADKPSYHKLPSYIAPKTFAWALASQLLGDEPPTTDNLIRQINASASVPPNIKSPLIFLVRSARGDIDAALKNIEDWYSAMGERLTGWYKKHTQTVAFVIAALLVVVGNVDTLTIARSLVVNDTLRQQIAMSAEQFVQTVPLQQNQPQAAAQKGGTAATGNTAGTDAVETDLHCGAARTAEQCLQLQMTKLAELNRLGLPIGWQNQHDPRIWPQDCWAWLEKFFGLLLTAIAVSLGAPFWFDILNKFMNFRSSLKPQASDAANPARKTDRDAGAGVG